MYDLAKSELKLEPSSLYVATQTIPTSGFQAFHWFILVTNAEGATTSHQWAESKGGTGDTAEKYIRITAPTCAAYTKNPSIVSYFRVKGYLGPGDGSGTGTPGGDDAMDTDADAAGVAQEADAFAEAFEDVFPQHYGTMHENRQHGLSCRVWVLRVLQALQRSGFIHRPDDVAGIEGRIKATSAEQEEALMKTLLSGKRFTASVFSI